MTDREEDELPRELRAALDRLDARAQAAAQRVDATRVSERVRQRLMAEGRTDGQPGSRWLRMAAAVALIAAGAATAIVMSRGRAAVSATLPVNIDSLAPSDSQAIMTAMDEVRSAADTTAVSSVVTVDDLNEQELRALLQALENEETL